MGKVDVSPRKHPSHPLLPGILNPLMQAVINPEFFSDWRGNYDYVVCVRSILNSLIFDRIKILSKRSLKAWTRDAWLTNSEWASRDFILHEWKNENLDKTGYEGWYSPFRANVTFDLPRCSLSAEPLQQWEWKRQYMKTDAFINRKLEAIFDSTEERFKTRAKNLRKKYELDFDF